MPVVRGGPLRQGVPQHVRQSETVHVRRNPDEVRLGASTKITWLQSALAVLGEDDAVKRSALEACSQESASVSRDFMCFCAEEVIEWISDRQFDIQEEIKKGNVGEVARLSSFVVQAATSLQPVHTSMVAQFVPTPETSSATGSFGQVTVVTELERPATQDHQNHR